MSTLLERNLRMLQEYDAPLAERLRGHSRSPHVELIANDPKFPSARIHAGGRQHLLHSSRNPSREAQRWCESFPDEPVYNMIVFGCGLMYHVFQLVMKYKDTLRHLTIIEKDLDVVHAAFSVMDLSPFLKTQNTFFLIQPDAAALREHSNQHITSYTLDGLKCFDHPASVELDPAYYRQLHQVLDEAMLSGEILLRTKVRLGPIIQENIIRNVPNLINNPTASALNSLFSGTPAFVVGAGPSLDRNIDELSHVGDQGVIIAVDTVFKKLRFHRIEPHLVVTTDPTSLNQKHFDGIHALNQTMLVFSPSVMAEIPKHLQGNKLSLPLQSSRFLHTLSNTLGSLNYMTVGTNVGQCCFNLAQFLGCDPIVLVGMDFGFSAAGGKTHASETAWQRTIRLAQTEGKMTVELIGSVPELEEFDPYYVPGNYAPQVATSEFWLSYLRSFEKSVETCENRVINATEGGARIQGTEIMPLCQAIQTVCRQNAMVFNTLQMAVGFFFSMGGEEGKAVLEESKNILSHAIEKAEEGLRHVERLRVLINDPNPKPEVLREAIEAINASHEALVQGQKVYVVLGEAADQVLASFLRKENRPVGDETHPDNVHKTIQRYEVYFNEMARICRQFQPIVTETLETLEHDADSFDSFGSFEL